MEMMVLDRMEWMGAGVAATALLTLASLAYCAGPAEAAVVYCKTVGVPKGRVARPGAPVEAVVAAPGVAVAGAGVGAPGVGVRLPPAASTMSSLAPGRRGATAIFMGTLWGCRGR
jgi:hypothetical protein